jgi:deazaflavin-dependent oxidoreductase (nitroreductase family)
MDTMTDVDRGDERTDAPTDGVALTAKPPPRALAMLLPAVRYATRLTRPLAGRRFFPLWAVLRHRGRKTGREYAVPVGVRATADAYFIALPFGERTQWVHNVVAADGCTIRWRGKDTVLAHPMIVRADEAAFAFPPVLRWMMRAAGASQVVRLRPADDPLA